MLKGNCGKGIIVFFVLVLVLAIFCVPVFAAPDVGLDYARDIGLEGEGVSLQDFIVRIVKLLMTFLGILATAIIMLGGFKWMTSGGNSEQADIAKGVITSGIIGIVITLSAFMIVDWVFRTTSNDILGGEAVEVYN